MSAKTTLKDDIDFITDEINAIKPIKSHTRKLSLIRYIKVRGTLECARDDYKKAKRAHRAQIRQLRRQIHSHKLMIGQAKTVYKIVKLGNS